MSLFLQVCCTTIIYIFFCSNTYWFLWHMENKSLKLSRTLKLFLAIEVKISFPGIKLCFWWTWFATLLLFAFLNSDVLCTLGRLWDYLYTNNLNDSVLKVGMSKMEPVSTERGKVMAKEAHGTQVCCIYSSYEYLGTTCIKCVWRISMWSLLLAWKTNANRRFEIECKSSPRCGCPPYWGRHRAWKG